MWSGMHKGWKISANSAFGLVFLSTGLFLLLMDAQVKQQLKIPISQDNIYNR